MAFKQPRVPEYRERDGADGYIRSLVLFLKDFCMDVWTANNQRTGEIDRLKGSIPEMPEIRYPVTSVCGKTGDVTLTAGDVGALEQNGTAVNASKLGGKTMAQLLLTVYPVGSIYLSVNSTSPASLFGGTWEQLQDRFLLGASGGYAAGSTGGEATHTLSIGEIPSHAGHLYGNAGGLNGKGDAKGRWLAELKRNGLSTSYGWNYSDNEYYPANRSLGGGAAHNNMPPYLAVYMWKRVS